MVLCVAIFLFCFHVVLFLHIIMLIITVDGHFLFYLLFCVGKRYMNVQNSLI